MTMKDGEPVVAFYQQIPQLKKRESKKAILLKKLMVQLQRDETSRSRQKSEVKRNFPLN